jgi:hypothetical protein
MLSNFKNDLKFGEKYEYLLKNHLYNIKHFEKIEGKFSDYDIKTIDNNDNIICYEVKADKLAYKTNNIAIEYMSYNKQSGINVTTADYWAYFIINNNKYDLYIIPTNIIKDKINDKLYKLDCIGGEFKKSRLYIFSLNLFEEYKIDTNI